MFYESDDAKAARLESEAERAMFADKAAYCREMDRLSGLLRKYKHRWVVYVNGERQEPSQRLGNWVGRFQNLRLNYANFSAWIDSRGLEVHDAYDILA